MTTTARIRTVWDDRQHVGCLTYGGAPFGSLFVSCLNLETTARFLRAAGAEKRWHNHPALEDLLFLMDGVTDYIASLHGRPLDELTHEQLAQAIDEWQDMPRDERLRYVINDPN